MKQTYLPGSRPYSVGSQGGAGAELPAARGMGHRQHGLLGIRVYGLPHPSEGGPGEEASDETGCGQGVPPEDHRSPPDVGHRRLLLQSRRLGLLLPGHRHGRLLPFHPFDKLRTGLAYRLQRDMTSNSFIEVVQDAVDRTGMDRVPITDRTPGC